MPSTPLSLWMLAAGSIASWVTRPRWSARLIHQEWAAAGFLCLLFLGVTFCAYPSFAGDSIYGKVTAVKSADLVTLDNGSAQFEIRIVGIDVPREGPLAEKAKEFVSGLVLGKNARARFEGRRTSGEMESQLLTADSQTEIKDVGLEVVRVGLARRQQGEDAQFGYKYGELSKAQDEARSTQRGLWAPTQPQ